MRHGPIQRQISYYVFDFKDLRAAELIKKGAYLRLQVAPRQGRTKKTTWELPLANAPFGSVARRALEQGLQQAMKNGFANWEELHSQLLAEEREGEILRDKKEAQRRARPLLVRTESGAADTRPRVGAGQAPQICQISFFLKCWKKTRKTILTFLVFLIS